MGTAAGVFRLVDGGLQPAGLTAVRDVARAAGVPLVATDEGLYELGNGWLAVLDGPFELVAGARDGRAHAASQASCFGRDGAGSGALVLPLDDPIVAVAYGETTYLLTAAGHLLLEATSGWTRTPLGVEGAVAAAVL